MKKKKKKLPQNLEEFLAHVARIFELKQLISTAAVEAGLYRALMRRREAAGVEVSQRGGTTLSEARRRHLSIKACQAMHSVELRELRAVLVSPNVRLMGREGFSARYVSRSEPSGCMVDTKVVHQK